MLLGRYLSGASLPLDEQRDLIRFLSERYADRDEIRADPVFSFIEQKKWNPESFAPPELAFVSGIGLIPKKRKMGEMV